MRSLIALLVLLSACGNVTSDGPEVAGGAAGAAGGSTSASGGRASAAGSGGEAAAGASGGAGDLGGRGEGGHADAAGGAAGAGAPAGANSAPECPGTFFSQNGNGCGGIFSPAGNWTCITGCQVSLNGTRPSVSSCVFSSKRYYCVDSCSDCQP